MKAVKDGIKVLKGQITLNTYNGIENRIQLWDGKFTTGYRVTEFRICPRTPTSQEEIMAIISTEPKSSLGSTFNFQDNENVAYYLWNAPNQTEHSEWKLIVDGNMAIEDLWLSVYTTGDEPLVNYYIILEKYSMSDWEGAGVLVQVVHSFDKISCLLASLPDLYLISNHATLHISLWLQTQSRIFCRI